MATLYVGGRLFDGEKVHDGQAVLEEGGRIKRVAPQGEFTGFVGERVSADLVVCDGDALADIKRAAGKENHRLVVKRGVVARDNRAAFVRQPTRVAAE